MNNKPAIRHPKRELPAFEPTDDDLIKEMLREFDKAELRDMPQPMLASIISLVEKAMNKRGPNLHPEELAGIRELVTEHIYPNWWVSQFRSRE